MKRLSVFLVTVIVTVIVAAFTPTTVFASGGTSHAGYGTHGYKPYSRYQDHSYKPHTKYHAQHYKRHAGHGAYGHKGKYHNTCYVSPKFKSRYGSVCPNSNTGPKTERKSYPFAGGINQAPIDVE
jgi:hypothetical protein